KASGPGSYTVTDNITRDGCPGSCPKTVTVTTCIGNIFPTETTCSLFNAGTATNLDSACYQFSGGGTKKVSNAQPGVFFYFVKVKLTSFPSTVTVTETKDVSSFLFFTLNNGHSWVYTGGCVTLSTGTAKTKVNANSNVTFTFVVNKGTPGDYIFALQL